MTLQAKFSALSDALNQRHFERYIETEIALVALLAKYHVTWLGPPGTAKSMLSNDLTEALTGARIFTYLLGKYTTPEEIHGPFDVSKIKEGKYERIIKGKLPDCEIAFVDEWFKANSAIQNSNLTIMNERLFDNGTERIEVPLLTLFAASNELPEGEELWALFDRFHFRRQVDYITEPGNFINMLKAPEKVELPQIALDELRQAQEQVEQVEVTDAVRETVYEIRADLQMEGIVVSDRRFKQTIKALQALAWLDGHDTVIDDHFRIMEHMLWTQPQELKKVARVIRKHTNPLEIKVQEIMDVTDEIAGKLHAAIMDAKAKDVDPSQALVKQGIEWFTNCQALGKQLQSVDEEAKKLGRPRIRIQQARDRLLRVMKEIGRHTIKLDIDLEL